MRKLSIIIAVFFVINAMGKDVQVVYNVQPECLEIYDESVVYMGISELESYKNKLTVCWKKYDKAMLLYQDSTDIDKWHAEKEIISLVINDVKEEVVNRLDRALVLAKNINDIDKVIDIYREILRENVNDTLDEKINKKIQEINKNELPENIDKNHMLKNNYGEKMKIRKKINRNIINKHSVYVF